MEEQQEAAVTRMQITLQLDENEDIATVVEDLPDYCRSSFVPDAESPNQWRGDFVITCPVAPDLAEGDLIDDFSPHLRELLWLKVLNNAEYELFVAVGPPGPVIFHLAPHTVALLAALGAKITVIQNR